MFSSLPRLSGWSCWGRELFFHSVEYLNSEYFGFVFGVKMKGTEFIEEGALLEVC